MLQILYFESEKNDPYPLPNPSDLRPLTESRDPLEVSASKKAV